MLVFIVLVWFTMTFVWPLILGMMEERSRKIAQGLAAAEQGQQELAQARERADATTTAGPYAKAASREARGRKLLAAWSEALRVAAAVVKDPRVATLLGNPRVTASELAKLVIDIAGPQLGEYGGNFVRALAEN